MGSWIDVPDFVNNEVRRIDTFQDIWANLYSLKNPEFVDNPILDDNAVWTTTSSSFADVNGTAYRLQMETHGGDLMICFPFAGGDSGTLAAAIKLQLEIDGTTFGNSEGLARLQQISTSQSEQTTYLYYIAQGLETGEHTRQRGRGAIAHDNRSGVYRPRSLCLLEMLPSIAPQTRMSQQRAIR